MNNNSILSDENKRIADKFTDLLAQNQKEREKSILEALREFEEGKSIGPFDTADDLMAELNA